MRASQKAFLLLAVVVCSVNGQRSGNGASNASGTAAGEVGLPGGSVESVTGAVVGRGSSVGFSGFRFVSANSTRGAPARFETGNSASRDFSNGPVAASAGTVAGSAVIFANLFGDSRASDNHTANAGSNVSGTGQGSIGVTSVSVASAGRRSPSSSSSSPSPSSSPSSSPMMGGRRLLG